VRCEEAELAISVAMDSTDPRPEDVTKHAKGCPRCRGFEDAAVRLRKTVRLAAAPSVPDLAPAILDRLRERPQRHRTTAAAPGAKLGDRPWRLRRAVAAGLVAGLVLGFGVTRSGLLPGQGTTAALAAEVPRELVRAAVELRGYRATFDIIERNWTRQVPERTFVASVAFRAPEEFRADVRDTTRYPTASWPRNDLSLVTTGRSWRTSGPDPCPAADEPICAGGATSVREVIGRPPFDQETAMPSDIIVPMTVLAAQQRVPVVGQGTIDGRRAVEVGLSYQDASPLFRSFEFLGAWRPYFPQDRVRVWLDRVTWFPLRYAVYPAAGPERRLWAAQAGLPPESSSRAVFVAAVRALSTSPPSQGTFALPSDTSMRSQVRDEGFRHLPPPSAPGWIRPGSAGGLRLVDFGTFVRTVERPYEETVAAYSSGLAWLTVSRVTGWRADQAFGVGGFAERIVLPERKGIAYYEPATGSAPRRLAMHTTAGELLIASNLPAAALTRIAASLPEAGRELPVAWRTHRWPGGEVLGGLDPATAIRLAPFAAEMPAAIAGGYAPVAAQLTHMAGGTEITIVFRRGPAEIDGVGLQLSEAPGQSLPPPTDPAEEEVAIRGVLGRWSPDQHLLEWARDGVYFSLSGPDFDLSEMLSVAASLRPPVAAG
jgi:hypothetical protein